MQVGETVDAEQLKWIKQMGVDYLNVQTGKGRGTLANFLDIKKRAEAADLKVWNISNNDNRNIEEVTLNLPGRDAKIAWLQQYIRDTGKAGIGYITYAHMANGIWSSDRETIRGGASARSFKLATAKGHWNGKVYEGPLTHGRKYSKEELWENYAYFIKQIAPVAEEAGVRIGIHPDDPPVPELGGIPRHIFGTYDGYVRALEIANSPAIGVCLCCGTWMEGGKSTGKDVYEAVRGFAKMGKLWKIHFRNVSSPIPDFVETYIDNGYTDMYKLMRTLVEVDFRGNLIADHVPEMAGGRNNGWSYSMGYIRALYQAARAELKKG
jgi:mannonate dehydratase